MPALAISMERGTYTNKIYKQKIKLLWICKWYYQYSNCRGDAYPHREVAPPPSRFSVPHQDLGVPPSRFERWMIRRKRPNPPPNFGKNSYNFRRRPFFGLNLIFGKTDLNFRRRLFSSFWSSFNFGDGNTSFSLNFLQSWSRLQKRPLMQNFTI